MSSPIVSATGRRRPPRIAVLGADGFIGSHAMQVAQRAGATTIGFCLKDPWRLSGESHRLARIPGGEWWAEDFLSELNNALPQIDALLLLAYTPPPDQRVEAWESHEWAINVSGAESILDLTSRHGVRLVFASSADVYGSGQAGRVEEKTEPQPATPYARAKRAAEELIEQAAVSGDACALRIATVYGAGENGPRAIPSFIRAFLSGTRPQVHGPGTDVRDYVHVRDVGVALLQATLVEREQIQDCGGIFNVGSGIGRSTRDVLATVASVMGTQPRAEQISSTRTPSHLVLDPSRAKRVLGFRADQDFETGVREEVEWLRRRLSRRRESSELETGAS
jgi:UDP-glucose 4-epimerase